ncbi:DUF6455 family protein [Bosea sp. (in: a-proteobacteria)]|uniref:DUF6455 family protein n=1 Tax=Bosea sp. (in: a-proteobacteria) TaxID=1871050 RepID=UPI002FCAC20B
MHLSELAQRWWQRRSGLRELDGLGHDALRELARDVAMNEVDLYNLVSRNASDAGLLPRLLANTGLDADRLSLQQPVVMRDMAIVCAGCAMTQRCRRELDRDEADLNYRQYCPNADTIGALRQERPRRARLRAV